ncbi:MAG: hypothetical protein ACPHID_04915 [Thermoplasmatota archaeon]
MRFLALATVLLLAFAIPTDAASTESADAEICKDTQRKVVQGVIVSTDRDCDVQADVRIQECVWGGYWDTTQAGPLTLRVYKCSPPHAAAATQGPCGSQKDVGIGTLYLSDNCYVQLDIKFYDCIWGGHWDEYGNKFAKVRVYSCDPYPPTATSMDARPCPAYSGSSWAVSFETRSDCTGWVFVGDSSRLCPALGMRPAGSTVQSVGPVTVGAMNCAPY